MKQENGLNEELAYLISDYLAQKPHRSLRSLSRTTGLGYITVRRMSNQKSRPSFATAWALAQNILEPEEAKNLLSKYFPDNFKDITPNRGIVPPSSDAPILHGIHTISIEKAKLPIARRILKHALESIEKLEATSEDRQTCNLAMFFQQDQS